MKQFRRKTNTILSSFAIIGIVAAFAVSVFGAASTNALSGSQFNKANIISDGIFFNEASMSASQIQSFLNSKVPVCDTNGTQPYAGTTRAAYGASRGYPAPYTCLKDYTQNTPARSADAYCSGSIGGGTRTAARIIYDVARACDVSPKTLIVLLQKEQSLITDDWPWSIQYRSATGYGCPDTAPCDSDYYGFFNQVYNAARQFQRYVKQPNSFNYASGRTSYIAYQANAPSCGGTNVGIQNGATAALYNYTPYQPNAAALANLYGTGDSCSAYGNRNFWRMFNDWFGSTQTTYSGTVTSARLFSNAARTTEISGTPSLRSGDKIYARVEVLNTGSRTWSNPASRVGTNNPHNRSSSFADGTWISAGRPTNMKESSIAPTETATFDFVLTAPNSDGAYTERFQVLIEGIVWVSDTDFSFGLNVSNPYNADIVSVEAFRDAALTRRTSYLAKTDDKIYWRVAAKNTGQNTWSNSNVRIGTTNPNNRPSDVRDGSWVSNARPARLEQSAVAPGGTGTFLYSTTSSTAGTFDEDFMLLAENISWMPGSGFSTLIRHQDSMDRLYGSDFLVGGDILSNPNYRIVLQGDGNLVIYNPSGHPVWFTGRRGGQKLVLQGDGNLVMYAANGKPVWFTGTRGANRLVIQGDGNLVLYSPSGRAVWSSGTRGT